MENQDQKQNLPEKMISADINFKIKSKGGQWVCPQCSSTNSSNDDICGSCQYPEVRVQNLIKKRDTVVAELQDFNSQIKNQQYQILKFKPWGCAACYFLNKINPSQCEICSTNRPEPNEKVMIDFGSSPNIWFCPMCQNENSIEKDKCQICQSQIEFDDDIQQQSQSQIGETLLPSEQLESDYNDENQQKKLDNQGSDIQGQLYGTLIMEKGVMFKVWAANAKKCFVLGAFNNWSSNKNRLKLCLDGYFRGFIEEAQEGDEYKYLFITQNNEKLYRSDPRSLQLIKQPQKGYHSIICNPKQFKWEDENFKQPLINKLIMYELHIHSFGKNEQDQFGTFKNCIDRLDHLAYLGINCIEVMPVNLDQHNVCWGYDPVSLFAIHNQFGTYLDLMNFINEAHKRGIAVVLDWVVNHVAPYNIFENYDRLKGSCYFSDDQTEKHTDYGPKLDIKNKFVREYLLDSLKMFIIDFHFDGLRVDSTNTLCVNVVKGTVIPEAWAFWQECSDTMKKLDPNKYWIAEDLQNNPYVHYTAGFQMQWDASFFSILYYITVCLSDDDRNLFQLADEIKKNFTTNPFWRIIYYENHDTAPDNRQQRTPKAITSNNTAKSYYSLKRTLLAATTLFTIPGVPMILQGQEVYQIDSCNWPDPIIVNWNLILENQNVYEAFRLLILLRSGKLNVCQGLQGNQLNIYHINNYNKVLAIQRTDFTGPLDDTIVILNFSNCAYDQYRIGMPRIGKWLLRFNSDDQIFSEQFEGIGKSIIVAENTQQDGYLYSAVLEIGRYSALIYSQDKQ